MHILTQGIFKEMGFYIIIIIIIILVAITSMPQPIWKGTGFFKKCVGSLPYF